MSDAWGFELWVREEKRMVTYGMEKKKSFHSFPKRCSCLGINFSMRINFLLISVNFSIQISKTERLK